MKEKPALGANTYMGATVIEVGTAVVVVSTDYIGSGLMLTVPASAPADGVHTVFAVSGDHTILSGVSAGAT